MAAMGLEDGEHHIGQMMVKVQGRRAVLAGTNTLAGSVATMDECVRVFINDAGMYVTIYLMKTCLGISQENQNNRRSL